MCFVGGDVFDHREKRERERERGWGGNESEGTKERDNLLLLHISSEQGSFEWVASSLKQSLCFYPHL